MTRLSRKFDGSEFPLKSINKPLSPVPRQHEEGSVLRKDVRPLQTDESYDSKYLIPRETREFKPVSAPAITPHTTHALDQLPANSATKTPHGPATPQGLNAWVKHKCNKDDKIMYTWQEQTAMVRYGKTIYKPKDSYSHMGGSRQSGSKDGK